MKVDIDINLGKNEETTENGDKKIPLARHQWVSSRDPNWASVSSEKSPLIEISQEKKNWISCEKLPESIPFIKLVVPFRSFMPSNLENDGEEVRNKIGEVNWNKMIDDAIIIGTENDQLSTCFKSCNGVLPYICLPCFCCSNCNRDNHAEVSSLKWSKIFEKYKIPFQIAHKPGSMIDALLSANSDRAPNLFGYVIDIEKIYIESVAPKKTKSKNSQNKTEKVGKTPFSNDCGCLCFDTSISTDNNSDSQPKTEIKQTNKKKKNNRADKEQQADR
jgi:hypothetical protein